MSQPGNNEFKNNTIIENETNTSNEKKTIKRMNNSTRINIKNRLVELQRKTKEWSTLKNNIKENSPYDLLRKDFARLDNYSNKINSLKTQSLNQDDNLRNLKNNLLAYYVTYNHALTLMNQYETYLTPKNDNNNSELQKLEILINTTSENYANNTKSFKDRFVKLNELLLSNYDSFKKSFEEHENYYNLGFGQACIVLRNYYIALIENFEKEVQNFNSSAANILKKLLELVKTIENNPDNLKSINNKYKNLFNKTNVRNLKNLFNNLSRKSENNLIKNKRNIKSIKNLLNRPLKIGQSSVELKDIITLQNIPKTIPITSVNNNITKVLTYYNTKLAERITDINNLLKQYEELCKQLKASIEIARKSKGETSDLNQINRIQNKVDTIMEQYIQLETIGTNCKNLGKHIHNLRGNTTPGNTTPRNTNERNMVVPHESSREIPVSRNVENNLSSFNGGKFSSPRNKAQFIFDYLLNMKKKEGLPHLHGTDNNSALDNDGNIKNKEKLQQIYNKFTARNFIPRNLRNSVKKGVKMPENSPGYSNNIRFGKQNSNTYNDRIMFAIKNKKWLVTYLENKLK